MPTLADLFNSFNAYPSQYAGKSLSEIADPDAVMNSPVSQFAFMGSTTPKLQALQVLRDRIIQGTEGLTGEAKYAALRDLAQQMRSLYAEMPPTAGAAAVPQDVSTMRAIMERIAQLRLNPLRFK